MQLWFDLLSLMFNTMIFSFATPFFWLVIFIVFMQYRRTITLEKKLFGRNINSGAKQTVYSILFGLMGGVFGSFLLLLLGVSLDKIGIIYLWPVAILLYLFNPRFLCFAYAGGLLAVVSLLLRVLHSFYPALADWPLIVGIMGVHLPGLLALVGILHLTEALLILLSGHLGASPIYLKTPSGKVVGGFSMQRFWPLPLMGLWAQLVAETSEMFVGGVAMPEWWPLLGTVLQPGGGEKIVYLMVPLVAGLGYSDLALSSRPREKRVKTAFHLAIYSLILSAATLASIYYSPLIVAAALIAPLGHEFLIKMGNASELSATPLFQAGINGPQVMAVVPGSAAERAGIRSGDRLLAADDYPLYGERNFQQILFPRIGSRIFLKLDRKGREIAVPLELNLQEFSQGGGFIFSPGPETTVYLEMNRGSFLDKLRRRRAKG